VERAARGREEIRSGRVTGRDVFDPSMSSDGASSADVHEIDVYLSTA